MLESGRERAGTLDTERAVFKIVRKKPLERTIRYCRGSQYDTHKITKIKKILKNEAL